MSLIKNKKFKTIVILAVLGIIASGFFSQTNAQMRIPPESKESCQGVIVRGKTSSSTPTPSNLEVTYPVINGVVPIATGKNVLPVFIKYLFYLAIAIAGFIAFGAMLYGGFKYLTSAGNPSATDEARKQIIAGLLGIIVLLGSTLFLNTINPKLTILSLQKLDVKAIENQIGAAPGVYLLSSLNDTTTAGNLIIRHNVSTITSIPSLSAYNFDNKTQDICFAPDYQKELFFRAVLHTEDNFQGKCRIFPFSIGGGLNAKSSIGDNVTNDVSSVSVYTTDFSMENYAKDFAVRLYKKSQLVGDPTKKDEVCTLSASEFINATPIGTACPGWTPDSVGSLEVGYGWVLATFQNDNGTGRCQIFGSGKVPELKSTYIGQCVPAVNTSQSSEFSIDIPPFEGYWKPCIGSIAIFQGNLQQ